MKTVTFSLREHCEVLALKSIIRAMEQEGYRNLNWRVLAAAVNTDFNFCSLQESFQNGWDVSVITAEDIRTGDAVFGFQTDMKHEYDQFVREFFDCSAVASCRLYRKSPLRIQEVGGKTVVIGNVKVKSPIEGFQLAIFERLATLPYRIVVVPRHPLSDADMEKVVLPKGVEFHNTMGELESLYANAQLAVMGRIFCFEGLKPDDDHNPLEATINGHAICGINNKIPDAYRWLYESSGLLHPCSTYEQVFALIEELLEDGGIEEKLLRRQQWIESNCQRHLAPIKQAILSSVFS